MPRRAGPLLLLLLLGLGLARGVPPARANPLAQFRTPLGTLEVELLQDQRPETVANFIRYVESGRYDGTFLHRLLPNFLAAGGGYRAAGRGTPEAAYAAVEAFPPIPNETRLGGILTNVLGTLALGQVSNESNRLTSEFFFSLGDASAPFLTQNQGGYPVFGRVRRGLEVLQALNGFRPLTTSLPGTTNALVSIWDANLPPYLYGTAQFPVRVFDPRFNVQQQLETLVHLDITLLGVSVDRTPAGVRIGWDSVAGRPNVVEFTRSFPPVWETLARVPGTGARMTVEDASGETRRFHRVRVEY